MMKATLGKEIGIKVANKIGVLRDVAKIVAEKGVNIRALQGTVEGSDALLRLVTDDNLRATEALRAHRYHPFEETVVEMEAPNRPGILESIATRLAMDGIDIYHVYATAGSGEATCRVVLSCSDNERAVMSMNR